MAFSKFLVRYDWGQCAVAVEELKFWKPAVSDFAGGSQLATGVELTNEELQVDVPTILESGEGKLNDLKHTSDPRCSWVEDIGWTSS